MEDSRLTLMESNPRVIQAIILLAILLPIGLLPIFLKRNALQEDSSKFKYLDLGNQSQQPKTKSDSTKLDQPQKPEPEPGLSGYELRELERRIREFTKEKTTCNNGYPSNTSYLVSQGNKDWRVFAEIYCKGRHGIRCGILAYQKSSNRIYNKNT